MSGRKGDDENLNEKKNINEEEDIGDVSVGQKVRLINTTRK